MSYIIKTEDITKNYSRAEIDALKGISFEVEEGDFVLLCGDSGSGKSTVLNIIGGMDRPTSGKVYFYDTDITTFNDKQMSEYRRKYIGFVFQSYNLINNLSALENIMLVGEEQEGIRLLKTMGLADKINSFPAELSGGEAQRVAIARAMAKSPSVLLCDEPTGALDYENSRKVMSILLDLNRESGITVLMVSHNPAFVPLADKVIKLKSGWIESVTQNDSPKSVDEIDW